jgi:hypothetical protein
MIAGGLALVAALAAAQGASCPAGDQGRIDRLSERIAALEQRVARLERGLETAPLRVFPGPVRIQGSTPFTIERHGPAPPVPPGLRRRINDVPYYITPVDER